MASPTSVPNAARLLTPILPALPAAALSSEPAPGVLQSLTPILRHRVEYLSSSTSGPWLRLLCYDSTKAQKLADIVQGGRLEPHPVSGEVEVDWDRDIETRYRRIDSETLQALVAIPSLGLSFRLEYCAEERSASDDGWRIAEVTIIDGSSPFSTFAGKSTIAEAEAAFQDIRKPAPVVNGHGADGPANGVNGTGKTTSLSDDDDDDDYWARYDATPARTPATKRSPAPRSLQSTQQLQAEPTTQPASLPRSSSAEDAYFAQYDSVQPAMDNDDPDGHENNAAMSPVQPVPTYAANFSRGERSGSTTEPVEIDGVNGGSWTLTERVDAEVSRPIELQHPRPASASSGAGSHSSGRSQTVARLEADADKRDQSEFGVKQHVSRSIRSLFLLSRAAGIDREEFERLVRTELDLLGMMDED